MIYGIDISTSIIGLAQFDEDGKYLSSDHHDLRNIEDMMEKCDAVDRWLTDIGAFEDYNASTFFVEDRLGNFSGGKTTMQTLMKLASFNMVVSYIIHRSDPAAKIIHLHPATWKSVMKRDGLFIPKGADKKKLTLEFVQKKEPNFAVDLNRNGNPHPWNFDRADAYCLGRAGYLKCIAPEKSRLSGMS